jgi:hypothetical protein
MVSGSNISAESIRCKVHGLLFHPSWFIFSPIWIQAGYWRKELVSGRSLEINGLRESWDLLSFGTRNALGKDVERKAKIRNPRESHNGNHEEIAHRQNLHKQFCEE